MSDLTFVDFLYKLLDSFWPLFSELFSIALIYIPLAGLAYAGYRIYLIMLPQYRDSEVNEWMIVIRDGEPVKSGAGVYKFTWYGDKVVKFPTHLRSVKFEAEQVTEEMMGIKVTGALIWSPHRDPNGPFKLYKAFGDELLKEESREINEKL